LFSSEHSGERVCDTMDAVSDVFHQSCLLKRLHSEVSFGDEVLHAEDGLFELILSNVKGSSHLISSVSQLIEFSNLGKVGVVPSSVQELFRELLGSFEVILLEGGLGFSLEVFCLDVLQHASLLLGWALGSYQALNLTRGRLQSATDGAGNTRRLLADGTSVSVKLVFRTGFKSSESIFFSIGREVSVVVQDSLEVSENLIVGEIAKAELVGSVSKARENVRRTVIVAFLGNGDSSEEGIFPIVELENESLEVLEVYNAQGSEAGERVFATLGLGEFSIFEVEDFSSFVCVGFLVEVFHCSGE